MGARDSEAAILQYARCPGERLFEQLRQALLVVPRCPVTHYLLGCRYVDRGRTALAVRHMMIAHHAQPQLESAALLVFAGLNWVGRRGAPLLAVLLDTWEEFRRPEFDRTRTERRLLDAFAEPPPALEDVSPLARRLWRLPIQALRAQLRQAVLSRDAGRYPLLLATA